MIQASNKLMINMETSIRTAKDLGKVVRDMRKSQKLTQDDLAGLTGTGRRFISDLENGKETAQIGKVFHVLSALGAFLSVTKKWKT